MTPAMQAEYTGFMSPDAWRAMLAAGPPPGVRQAAAS
jgi:hypothetical protein